MEEGGTCGAIPHLARAVDASAECEAALREAGLTLAAAHAHDATATLRLASRLATRQRRQDGDAPGASDGTEPLVGIDGRATGFMLVHAGDGVGKRRRAPGRTDEAARPHSPMRDLGWEIASSAAAARLARADLSAALLARALSDRGWVCADGSRWSASATGATAAVRLARGGRGFPALAHSPGQMLDAAAAALIASLGWRPERPQPPSEDL